MDRRQFIAGCALAVSLRPAMAAAHHGWAWATDEDFSLTGIIRSARLGNPHGLLGVESDGALWTVEVGQPWRNAEAGLTDAMLAPGAEVTIEGHRSADPAELRMKAERVIIAGTMHNLYPDRS